MTKRVMNRTNIEWIVNPDGSRGFTCNPIIGKCPHACWYCYAEHIRKKQMISEEMKFLKHRLKFRREAATIFIGSMFDIFADEVPHEWIEEIIETTKLYPQHTFLFLTKNPERYRDFFEINKNQNCWWGTTITGKNDMYRIKFLPPVRNFISFEPLLSEIDNGLFSKYKNWIEWIIIGSLNEYHKPVPPEQGGTRKEWVTDLIERAETYSIPVFIKDCLYELYSDLPERRQVPYLLSKNRNESPVHHRQLF